MKWNSELYDNSHNFVAKYGQDILSYLKPNKEETILDLGCGTGDLTHEIALSGAKVVGIDSSSEMIEKAKSKFPETEFKVMDVRELEYDSMFDAIFSNAALHWVTNKDLAIENMYKSLKKGGRLVVEFGGKGCVEILRKTLTEKLIQKEHYKNAALNFWYYPSIDEYALALEKHNFKVVRTELIDRPTPLTGEEGLRNWYLMFCTNYFNGISEMEKGEILNEIENELRASRFDGNDWVADYVRLRVVAIKTNTFKTN